MLQGREEEGAGIKGGIGQQGGGGGATQAVGPARGRRGIAGGSRAPDCLRMRKWPHLASLSCSCSCSDKGGWAPVSGAMASLNPSQNQN